TFPAVIGLMATCGAGLAGRRPGPVSIPHRADGDPRVKSQVEALIRRPRRGDSAATLRLCICTGESVEYGLPGRDGPTGPGRFQPPPSPLSLPSLSSSMLAPPVPA